MKLYIIVDKKTERIVHKTYNKYEAIKTYDKIKKDKKEVFADAIQM